MELEVRLRPGGASHQSRWHAKVEGHAVMAGPGGRCGFPPSSQFCVFPDCLLLLSCCCLCAVRYSEVEPAITAQGRAYRGTLDDFLELGDVSSAHGFTLLCVADVETNGWPIRPVRPYTIIMTV